MENEEIEHLIPVRVEGEKTYYRIGTSTNNHEIVFDDVIIGWIRELFYLLEYIVEEHEKRGVVIRKSEENVDSGSAVAK